MGRPYRQLTDRFAYPEPFADRGGTRRPRTERCSTSSAPWTLVEANNKYFARIKVLKTLCTAIEQAFDSMTGDKKQ